MDLVLYHVLLIGMFITAPICFVILFFYKVPYGKYSQKSRLSLPSRYGWIIMELPAVVVISYFFIVNKVSNPTYLLLMLWQIHYINRTFIYPFRLKNPLKPMPILVPFSGFIFNSINGYVNGVSLTIIHSYQITWYWDPRFIIGILIFIIGFIINQHADYVLLNLRKLNKNDYTIPQGGLYQWISCPNYLGEIIEWMGWAIATWSWAGLAFALWTMANLIPRAYSYHHWYQEKFPNYPKKRALI